MKRRPGDMARYTIMWRNPHTEPPRGKVLGARLVPAGEPCPPELLDLFTPGDGYCVSWQLVTQRPIVRWSAETKGRVRRRNLRKRLEKKVPLFADMFEAAELARRPDYFEGKDSIHNPL